MNPSFLVIVVMHLVPTAACVKRYAQAKAQAPQARTVFYGLGEQPPITQADVACNNIEVGYLSAASAVVNAPPDEVVTSTATTKKTK